MWSGHNSAKYLSQTNGYYHNFYFYLLNILKYGKLRQKNEENARFKSTPWWLLLYNLLVLSFMLYFLVNVQSVSHAC